MSARRPIVHGAALVVSLGILCGACRSHTNESTQPPPTQPQTPAPAQQPAPGTSVLNPPSGKQLQPVTVPDLSKMEPSVRDQMQSRSSSLAAKLKAPETSPTDLATAYGELGKLLMATSYFDAAEACLVNAEALAPTDARWPYYLGHMYKANGPAEKSVASFERALQLRPNDEATLIWLGGAYLLQGRADSADPLFRRALTVDPKSPAAHFGAGRVALAKKDYAEAVNQLEQALQLDPQATATHYQLAMAYRGRGDFARAEAELGKKGDIEPRPADPLMRQFDELLESAEAYNVRGGAELDAGNWAAAADDFRKGLELKPSDPSLRHRLGTALYQMGNVSGAMEQFQQVIRTSPEFAKAHFSLGVLMEAGGKHAEAIEDFSNAIKYDPGYLQARLQLAGALARSGRAEESLTHYKQALERNPGLKEAAFGYAMAFVRLHRYHEARDSLIEATKVFPDDPVIANGLARLLAAAPDAGVRDGRRAKTIVDELLKKQRTVDIGETVAMTLAELGEYEQAAALQRNLIATVEKAGASDVVRHLADNLRLYENRQPCRTPFTNAELP